MSDRIARTAGSVFVAAATAVVLVALAVVPFLSPAWVAFEQDRSEAAAWTGFAPAELRAATDAILADLVVGPPDFDVQVAGEPVLSEAERGHMRDVRAVFAAGALVALIAFGGLIAAAIATRGARWFWRAVRVGAIGLGAAIVAAGVIGVVAFEAAFELFHRLLFAGGNYTFDPRTDRLVQLFPQRFWFETSLVVGVAIVVLALITAWLAGRRANSSAGVPAGAAARPSLEGAR